MVKNVKVDSLKNILFKHYLHLISPVYYRSLFMEFPDNVLYPDIATPIVSEWYV